MSENEEIHVSETGAKKAGNLQRVGLVPPEFILALSKHYGVGAKKYAAHNWRGGYDWELSYNAAMRHLLQFWQGEDIDEETGSPHVISAAWHCCALSIFMEEHPELDTRWSTVNETLRAALRGEVDGDD